MPARWGRFSVVAAIVITLMGCGAEAADTGDESVSVVDQIESSEDCDELAEIRAEQNALAAEAAGTNAHAGFAIAARARMVAIGCDVEE